MSSETPHPNTNASPSLIAGHAKFAKGYAEETLGNVTGSKEWQESGKKDASAGIEEMKVPPPLSSPISLQF